ALRRARRSRRVDDRVRVLGAHLLLTGCELATVALAPSRAQLVQGHLATALVDSDYVLEVGQLVTDLVDLRALALVLAEDRPGAGVTRHPLALRRGVGRIHRHRHGTGRRYPKARQRP